MAYKKYLSSGSKIVEVGSNDGTFLKNFKNKNINAIGFEPSSTIANLANNKGVKTFDKFFNTSNMDLIKNFHNEVDVISSANVIAHIPDLKNVIKCVDKLLSKNGLLIFEEPYMGSMFSKVSYDQIYDEHIFMFSVSSIKKIFSLFDFELIDALPQFTHGGSMRYIVGRNKKLQINDNVLKIIDDEQKNKLDSIDSAFSLRKIVKIQN